jgi:hypothetical protein
MTWTKIISPKKIAASQIKASIAKTAGPGRGYSKILALYISIPTAIAGSNWEKDDRFDAFWGEGENEGRLMLTPGKEGEFAVRRLKFAISLRLPCHPGFAREERKSMPCAFERDKTSFIVTIPFKEWCEASPERKLADALVQELVPPKDTSGNGNALPQVRGRYIIIGQDNLRASSVEGAAAMKYLVQNIGERVSSDQLITAIAAECHIGRAHAMKRLGDAMMSLNNDIRKAGYEVIKANGEWLLCQEAMAARKQAS